jgi:hypothetical protein
MAKGGGGPKFGFGPTLTGRLFGEKMRRERRQIFKREVRKFLIWEPAQSFREMRRYDDLWSEK